jgi:hypothetical protein
MSAIDDLVSVMKGGVQNLGQLTIAFQDAFPRINGTFTLSNATVTVVTQPSIAASGIVLFTPKNATAALTQRTSGLFVSAVTAGVSFSISTQSGSALGSEIFSYICINPS